MTASKPTQRRSYGTGSLYCRTDSAGRESWYGHWRTAGRQIKRRVGPERDQVPRRRPTRRQAEAELRRLIAETPARPAIGQRLDIGWELGRRYLLHLERQLRKKATITAVRTSSTTGSSRTSACAASIRSSPRTCATSCAVWRRAGSGAERTGRSVQEHPQLRRDLERPVQVRRAEGLGHRQRRPPRRAPRVARRRRPVPTPWRSRHSRRGRGGRLSGA